MARYDKIARLDTPDREKAFPGWLVLGDLAGREREPELARRARLRFLALRPVRRLLDLGFDEIDRESLAQQVDSVRTALSELPGRDAERRRIAEYLHAIDERTPHGLASATIAMGEAAEADGHGCAAEEFYRTGLELAVRSRRTAQQMQALRCLGRLHAERGEWGQSAECLETAASMADATGHLVAWARALDGLAMLRLVQRDIDGARAVIDRIRARGEAENADRVLVIADAGACAVDVAAGCAEAAVEAGWRVVDALDPSDEDRNRTFLDLASAFRSMGMRAAAEACYQMVARSSGTRDHRTTARVQHALAAAEAGDTGAFRKRRDSLLSALDVNDHRIAATIHLGLGRGAMMIDNVEDARTHLRQAMGIARAGGLGDAAVVAEDLLSGLEHRADTEMRQDSSAPSAGVRTIADRIESLSRDLIVSS